MADEKSSSNDPKKVTPASWSSPEDARKNKSAGKYPNYYSHKTRSGHVFMMDDSNGAEHVTLQHRSGAMIQFMPDGAIQFVSHNGQYNIVFGESRMLITGAYDVVVQGGASLKVDGDYNVNVKGKMNVNVMGDYNITAQNYNQVIRGNKDVVAKNRTEKLEGSGVATAEGSQTVLSQGGMVLASIGDSLAIKSPSTIGVVAGGPLALQCGSRGSWQAGGGIGMDSNPIMLNSGFSQSASGITGMRKSVTPTQEPDTTIETA